MIAMYFLQTQFQGLEFSFRNSRTFKARANPVNYDRFSPWAKTPKIGFFVPIRGTSATIDFFNLYLLKFTKINDINAESVAFLVK